MSLYVLLMPNKEAFAEECVFPSFEAALQEAQDKWSQGEEVVLAELNVEADFDKPMCSAQTYPQTLETPAEYCENDTVLGSEYCSQHCEGPE